MGEKIEPRGSYQTLSVSFAGIDRQLAFDANLSFVSFDSEDADSRSDFPAPSVRDQVTVRCPFHVLHPPAPSW